MVHEEEDQSMQTLLRETNYHYYYLLNEGADIKELLHFWSPRDQYK